jgi:hypothetical protein
VISVYLEYIPEIPTDIITTYLAPTQNIKIAWSLPTDNGSPITQYKIFIKEIGTTTFTQESSDCDGTS